MKTTIRVSREVKELLDELKLHPGEPYDSVIRRLALSMIDDEPVSEDDLRRVEKALRDVRASRLLSSDEVRRELGLEKM